MLVQDLLGRSAESHADRPAIWHSGSWHTYREIDTRAAAFAGGLRRAGLDAGDRVVITCENSDAAVCAYFGILRAGGVVVWLHHTTPARELKRHLAHSGATALVADRRRGKVVLEAIEEPGAVRTVVVVGGPIGELPAGVDFFEAADFEKEKGGATGVRVAEGDLAQIVYTSGSTGEPKGVMLSHGNLTNNQQAIAEYLELTDRDRIAAILPFAYIYGKSLLLTHLLVGGSVVIDNRFVFPNSVLETMRDLECTGFSGVPTTFTVLLKRSALLKMEFPKLRYVTQAGGKLASNLIVEAAEAFAPARFFVMYGATEAAPRLSWLDPDRLEDKLGSIGKAVRDVEMAVFDDEDRPLGPGERGEIVAKGPNIMMGYWQDPEGTAAALRNGYYHTGDIGKTDEDGFFYVVGRKSEFVKVKGFRVSPYEIEGVISSVDGVREVAVVGTQDPVYGESLKAFVAIAEDSELTDKLLLRTISEDLPPHKIPSAVTFVDSLPKSPAGKVDKSKLT